MKNLSKADFKKSINNKKDSLIRDINKLTKTIELFEVNPQLVSKEEIDYSTIKINNKVEILTSKIKEYIDIFMEEDKDYLSYKSLVEDYPKTYETVMDMINLSIKGGYVKEEDVDENFILNYLKDELKTGFIKLK